MKKSFIVLLCLLSILLCGCGKSVTTKLHTKKADLACYYALDGTKTCFSQVTLQEALRMFDENGTGILFFSKPTCAWCNLAIDVLNETGIKNRKDIYYIDIEDPEFEVLSINEQYTLYEKLIDDLYEILPKETSADGSEKAVLFVPLLVAVKNGKITGNHLGLVESFHFVTGYEQLSQRQRSELSKIYQEVLGSI